LDTVNWDRRATRLQVELAELGMANIRQTPQGDARPCGDRTFRKVDLIPAIPWPTWASIYFLLYPPLSQGEFGDSQAPMPMSPMGTDDWVQLFGDFHKRQVARGIERALTGDYVVPLRDDSTLPILIPAAGFPLFRTFPTCTTGSGCTGSGLGRLLCQVGSFGRNLATAFIRGLQRLGHVAVVALLKAVGLDPGDVDRFFSRLARLAANAFSIGRGILFNPFRYAQRLIEGIPQGFQRFVGNFQSNILKSLYQWLFMPPSNAPLPNVPDGPSPAPTNAIGNLLSDLDWPSGLPTPSAVDLLFFFLSVLGFGTIKRNLNNLSNRPTQVQRLFDALQHKNLSNLNQFLTDNRIDLNPQRLTDEALRVTITTMQRELTVQLPALIAGLATRSFPPIGPILAAIQFVFTNISHILAFLETIGEALLAAVGQAAAAVAQAVEGVLKKLVDLLLRLIGSLIPQIPQILQRMGQAIERLRCRVKMGICPWLIPLGIGGVAGCGAAAQAGGGGQGAQGVAAAGAACALLATQQQQDPCSQAGLTANQRKWFYGRVVSVLDRRPRQTSNNTCTGTPTGTTNQRVVTRMVAWITSTGGGDFAKTAATDWVRCVLGQTSDQAGHVLGNLLGGKGERPPATIRPDCQGVTGADCFNIFPQNPSRNQGRMRWREQQVSRQVRPGNRVCVEIQLLYSGSNFDPLLPGRPGEVIYDVWVNYQQNPGDFNDPSRTWIPNIPNPK
jgi:hypothetical protein